MEAARRRAGREKKKIDRKTNLYEEKHHSPASWSKPVTPELRRQAEGDVSPNVLSLVSSLISLNVSTFSVDVRFAR